MNRALSALLLAAALAATPALAKTFKYASAFEPGSMDPHAMSSSYTTRVLNMIYDTLVSRDEDFRVKPGLALSWTPQGNGWRLKLRPNVKFHDGAPFSAEDVVFSVERALQPTSQSRFNLPNVTGAKKVDALTVDILTSAPTPVLPVALTNFRVMNRAWAVKHKVEKPQDFNAKEETYASRNANGTGPYKLKEWVPDVRTVLVANPDYWGDKGNVTEAHYLVVTSAATRLAGLVSGEIDFVIDPALQDVERLEKTPGVKLVKGAGRGAQYLGFDVARDTLIEGNAGGKNPFKDRRVRLAFRHAIDVEALNKKVMRGLGTAGRSLYTNAVDGYDKRFDKPAAYDLAKAKALLAEAGYPNGFAVNLHCSASQPADALCQAVASMLARVNVKVTYVPMPFNNLLPKVTGRELSFWAIGWTPATDAEGVLVPLVHTPNKAGDGDYNTGRYSNPKVDALIDQARVELDPAKRYALLNEAMAIVDDDVATITLTYRSNFWAMRTRVKTKVRPNDLLDLRYVNVD